jgi:hypothetical protein
MFEHLDYYVLVCELRQLKDAEARNELMPAEALVMNALHNELWRRNQEIGRQCITRETN